MANRYMPKNSGIIHAVLWRGEVADLVSLPNFNHIAVRVIGVDQRGMLTFVADGIGEVDIAPRDGMYIVVDSFGKFQVWGQKFLAENYDAVPEQGMTREVK